MNIRKITAVIMAALIIASFSACGSDKTSNNSTSEPVKLLDTAEMFSSKDIETGYDESECTVITLTGNSASINGKGASVKGSVITISSEGDYIISGKLDSGCITIITSSTCAAINVIQADKVFITLDKGSENTISNVSGANAEDDADAAIFSKDDLTINGQGKLTVTANTGHGIVSKDDLVITGGSYSITSEKKALDANDSLRIAGGSFTIDSGTDALHCENKDTAKGYIYIADGSFSITAGTDGMDASGIIQIDNGSFTIATGGGSSNASTKKGGEVNGGWGNWGGRGRHMSTTDSDASQITKLSTASGAGSTSDSSSAKGIKSDSSVVINNGAVTCDAAGTKLRARVAGINAHAGNSGDSANGDGESRARNRLRTHTGRPATPAWRGG